MLSWLVPQPTHGGNFCHLEREGGGLSKECLKFVQDVLRVGHIVIGGCLERAHNVC